MHPDAAAKVWQAHYADPWTVTRYAEGRRASCLDMRTCIA